MRSSTVAAWTLAPAVSLLAAAGTPAQPVRSPRIESTAASAVVVDVVVRDGSGRTVVNLGADDFEVYEDGVRQTIGAFTPPLRAQRAEGARVRAQAGAPGASGPAPASSAPPPSPGATPSTIAIVFDQLSLEGADLARRAAARYIGSGAEVDNYIGVFDVRDGLGVLQPFTRAGNLLRDAVRRSLTPQGTDVPLWFSRPQARAPQGGRGPLGPGSAAPQGPTPVSEDLDAVMSAAIQGFGGLEADATGYRSAHALIALAHALGGMAGRKTIVLFSEGLSYTPRTEHRFHSVIDEANRANVALYGVDAAGLRAVSEDQRTGQSLSRVTEDADGNLRAATSLADLEEKTFLMKRRPAYGLGLLSAETGGFLIDSTNDLSRVFRRVDEDAQSYYTLTYAPTNTKLDGRFRKIQVKVRRDGMTPRSRSGYLAVGGAVGAPILAYEAPAIARLATAPLPNEFPIRARGLVFPVTNETARLPLLVSVPRSVFTYRPDDASGSFAGEAVILTRLLDETGRVVHKASQQYTFSGRLDRLASARQGEVLFARQPEVATGVYTLEVIAYDVLSEKASVRVMSIEATHRASTFFLGTPFVVDRLEPSTPQDAKSPLRFGDLRLFPNIGEPLRQPLETLTFAFSAYSAGEAVRDAFVELSRGGATVARAPLKPAAPDPDGRIQQVNRLSIGALEPGVYELRVTLTTEVGVVTRATTFTIAASAGR